MDPKDYRIIVSELYDRISASLRHHAVERIEPIPGDNRLTLQFDDLREVTLASDPAAQRIRLSLDTTAHGSFYFHPVEEQWFEERTEDALADVVNQVLAGLTGRPVTIPNDELS